MEALEAVLTRRSTRKYTEKIPAKELVEKVIEAGTYAPSGHNNQSTHFFVFSGKELLSGSATPTQVFRAELLLKERAIP